MFFMAAIDGGSVNKGREFIQLLPRTSLTNGAGPNKVETRGSQVDPGVETVSRWNGNCETFRIVWCWIFTAIERFCNVKNM